MTGAALFWEYLLVGLLSFGGGMASIPFLQDMGERTGWFSRQALMDMIAVSESTPGPIGVNMATYVGYTVGGPLGAAAATAGFVLPGFLCALGLAFLLRRFRATAVIDRIFYGLRPISAALIAAALASVAGSALLTPGTGSLLARLDWPSLAIFAGVFALTRWVKPVQKLHPIVFLALSAAAGVLLGALTGWGR